MRETSRLYVGLGSARELLHNTVPDAKSAAI
jgi:hypothetical protein